MITTKKDRDKVFSFHKKTIITTEDLPERNLSKVAMMPSIFIYNKLISNFPDGNLVCLLSMKVQCC